MKNKEEQARYNLPTVDDFFEPTHGSYMGRIERVDLNRIKEFKDHPFKVKDDEEMARLVESVKENGKLCKVVRNGLRIRVECGIT